MARRRMFSIDIINSDVFMDMPMSTQLLYFHLAMRADDDGFVSNPRTIQRMIGASDDDIKVLLSKRYVLYFDSGIVAIKHWKMQNTIKKDRYKETTYIEERNMLMIDEKGAYTENSDEKTLIKSTENELEPEWNRNGTEMDTQVSLGKVSLGKVNNNIASPCDEPTTTTDENKTIKPVKKKYGEYKHVLLEDKQKQKLENDLGIEMTLKCITYLDEYIEMKGYKAKNHYLCIIRWVIDAVKKNKTSYQNKQQSFVLSNGVETTNPFMKMLEEEQMQNE